MHATWLSSGRGHHPGWLASALCHAGQSPLPRPVALVAPCTRTTCAPWPLPRCCPPATTALLLLASPADACALGAGRALPTPCPAPPWPLSPPGPAFASSAATPVPCLDSLTCLRAGQRPVSPSPRHRVAVSVGWYYPLRRHAAFRRLLQRPCERLSGARPEVPHDQARRYRALTPQTSHVVLGPPLSPLSPCRRDVSSNSP